MRPEPFKQWTRPMRLQRRLSRHVAGGQRLRVVTGGRPWPHAELRRETGRIAVTVGPRGDLADDRVHYYCKEFLPVALHLFARASDRVRHASVELSDGSSTPSRRMLFSASFADALLIPDPEFFNSNGYARQRRQLAAQRPWHEREAGLIWRGATTGDGRFPHEVETLADPALLPRIRACALLRGTADAKIYRVVQSPQPEGDERRLRDADLMGERIAEDAWLDRRFALDIDGNTSAWSNLFVRLIYGCCVLKVASPGNYRQWYYPRLQPWVHFVPVDSDLGNLTERLEWCRRRPDEAGAIAAAGQALALSMTFEAEMQRSVAALEAHRGSAPEPA